MAVRWPLPANLQVINEPHLHNDQEHHFLKSFFKETRRQHETTRDNAAHRIVSRSFPKKATGMYIVHYCMHICYVYYLVMITLSPAVLETLEIQIQQIQQQSVSMFFRRRTRAKQSGKRASPWISHVLSSPGHLTCTLMQQEE